MADIVIMIGGQGTQAGANNENAAAYLSTGSINWANAQSATGDAILESQSGLAIDDNAGDVRITGTFTGGGTSAFADMYANCTFSATYVDGRYKIKSSTVTTITIDLAWSTNTPTAIVVVGGALAADATGFQAALDLAIAGDIVKYAVDNGGTALLTTTVTFDLDAADGTSTEPILLEGVDNSGVVLNRTATLPVLRLEASQPGLLSVASDFVRIIGIDFNGNNNLAGVTDGILNIVANATNNSILDCRVHNCPTQGRAIVVSATATRILISGCEIYDAFSYGILCSTVDFYALGNSIHDNNIGLYFVSRAVVLFNSLYDNTSGAQAAGAGFVFAHNVCSENSSYGIRLDTAAIDAVITNNQFTYNSAYGIFLSTTANLPKYFLIHGNNAFGNGTNPINIGTWTTLDNGRWRNIEEDPKYVSRVDGSEDFRTRSKDILAGHPSTIGGISIKIPIGLSHKIPSARLMG